MNRYKYILASASPRRREILDTIGIAHTVVVSDYDEGLTPQDLPPDLLVMENSRGKGNAVADIISDRDAVIISSDTVVAMKEVDSYRVFGKPSSREEAIAMLTELSGKTHTVFTALTVIRKETGWSETCVDSTNVEFEVLTEEEILWYVDTLEPMDKAGAYAIQGLGARFVKKIDGNYHTVMGLPSHLVYKTLKDL